MWRAVLVLAILALPGASAELDPYMTLVDWVEGHAILPTTPLVSSPIADARDFDATECHPWLLLDLLYNTSQLDISVPGVGEATIFYEFRAEVWREGALVLEEGVSRSGYGHPLGRLSEAGGHTLRLSLATGVNVEYEMRLRARLATEDPACNPPVT